MFSLFLIKTHIRDVHYLPGSAHSFCEPCVTCFIRTTLPKVPTVLKKCPKNTKGPNTN